MSKQILHTKFGTASLNKYGHYLIFSWKEGNKGKYLHRVIWENFYGCKIPRGYVIHHKNGNPKDNCILNLQLLTRKEHNKIHNTGCNNGRYGKFTSDKVKRKISYSISKKNNSSGFYRVQKIKDKTCLQGFIWQYRYYENGKRKSIMSVDIKKLKKKVLAKELEWIEY